jgi:hypothetical protein
MSTSAEVQRYSVEDSLTHLKNYRKEDPED